MMEKMPLNGGITYSDIYSVNCLYCTGAFEPNGHLFCEYPVEKYEILIFLKVRPPALKS